MLNPPRTAATPRALTVLRGRNNLPVVEQFEGLVESQGAEALRIRFSLSHGRLLDLPLSAAALADLVQPLSALRGVTPEKIH
jgi:hypothetical protein